MTQQPPWWETARSYAHTTRNPAEHDRHDKTATDSLNDLQRIADHGTDTSPWDAAIAALEDRP